MIDHIIQSVIDWVNLVGPLGIYVIFTCIAYLENVVPPVPGDVLIVFSGYLVAEGIIDLFPIWILTVMSSVVGFMNMYWIGGKLEVQISGKQSNQRILKFFDYEYMMIAKAWMDKYGQWVIIGNRFLAGTRSVISITAGVFKLKLFNTIICSFISSALWNTLLISLGWVLKENWATIGSYLSTYGIFILVLILILFIVKILIPYLGKKAKK